MKKPLIDSYYRSMIINCPDAYCSQRLLLDISMHKCQREIIRGLAPYILPVINFICKYIVK